MMRIESVDRYVGLQIRALRERHCVKQTVLAEYLGITFQQVHKYEIGMNRVSCGRLYQIARFFHVSVAYFFPDMPNADQVLPIVPATIVGEAIAQLQETLTLLEEHMS